MGGAKGQNRLFKLPKLRCERLEREGDWPERCAMNLLLSSLYCYDYSYHMTILVRVLARGLCCGRLGGVAIVEQLELLLAELGQRDRARVCVAFSALRGCRPMSSMK